MKVDEEITAMSLYNAFKLIYERNKPKIHTDMQKLLIAFMLALGDLAIVSKMGESTSMDVEKITQKLSMKLENALGKGLEKLGNLIEASLANHKELQNSTKKLGEVAEVIQKTTMGINKNLAESLKYLKQTNHNGELIQGNATITAPPPTSWNEHKNKG